MTDKDNTEFLQECVRLANRITELRREFVALLTEQQGLVNIVKSLDGCRTQIPKDWTAADWRISNSIVPYLEAATEIDNQLTKIKEWLEAEVENVTILYRSYGMEPPVLRKSDEWPELIVPSEQ